MLKQTLSLLLSKFYSKQESADVGHQAMPSTSSVSITLPASNGTTEKEYSYTAPSDGYIVLRDKGYPKTASYVISNQYAEGITRPQSAIDINICTPVTKGSVTYLRYCGKNPTAQFIKLIGGVLSYLQGGAICLNHLLHSLLRSFLLARKNGYQLAQRLKADRLMLSLFPIRTLTRTRTSRLQPTGTSLLEAVQTRLILMCQLVRELLTKAKDYGRDFPLVLPRATPLVFGCMEARRLLRLSSIQTRGISLHTGGAL